MIILLASHGLLQMPVALLYQNIDFRMTTIVLALYQDNVEMSIGERSANPNSGVFHHPSPATVERGNYVIWISNDSAPHTAISGNPDNGEAPT